MRKTTRLAYAGAVVAVLVLALAVPAAAKTVTTGAPQGWVSGVCRGFGAAGDAIAGLLGMQPSEIAKERAGGKSLAAIAQEKGISKDKLVETMLQARREALSQAVKDGRITQTQADLMLERMKSNIQQRVSDPTAGGCARTGQAGGGCVMGGASGDCGGAAAATGNSL